MKYTGIVISGLRGGSGKTIVSVGLAAALSRRNHRVAPFKKGPDYIDAGWLAVAAGRPCYNLDSFLLPPPRLLRSFCDHAAADEFVLIEGNRGLYDCIETHGRTSTAELAKLLGLPVVLIIDGTKTTRTMAAVVSGCCQFDPALSICGVVLNRVAGSRHEGILRRSIEEHCGVPVIGALPRQRREIFPERHMGLVPTPEHGWAADSIAEAGRLAESHLDLDRLTAMAQGSRSLTAVPEAARPASIAAAGRRRPRIGVIRDSAFQFYYPENLDALEQQGAELVFCSPLDQDRLPQVDALYIGGGFPETHAGALAGNRAFADQLRRRAAAGLPVYAECGGLMYLGRELVLDSGTYPMAGVLPVTFGFSARPQGHGYTMIQVDGKNPFYEIGLELRGHEFHYSRVLDWRAETSDLAFRMRRGNGIADGRDGLCRGNVLATYTHIHALGQPQWARAMVRVAAGRMAAAD